MTDTKCPHCGADADIIRAGVNVGFRCGTILIDEHDLQSLQCCKFERDSLKAKVAAQQELLREARDTLCSLDTLHAVQVAERIDAMITN